ncbi:MAG: hypothetical protein HC827_06255 [Cyanobacteria bacterium RM1_2_2]|nr:hypothetical protein [Cyanobacteria bacterium RM1_2_2]
MLDPVSAAVTVEMIVSLAFQGFLNSEAGKASVGKVAEKLTEATLEKVGQLRKLIFERLRGKSPELQQIEAKVEQAGQITPEQLEEVKAYLHVEMNNDKQFAAEVKQLAAQIQQEINIAQMQGQQNNQIVYPGGHGQQFNNENIKAPVQQGTITNHHYYGNPPQS